MYNLAQKHNSRKKRKRRNYPIQRPSPKPKPKPRATNRSIHALRESATKKSFPEHSRNARNERRDDNASAAQRPWQQQENATSPTPPEGCAAASLPDRGQHPNSSKSAQHTILQPFQQTHQHSTAKPQPPRCHPTAVPQASRSNARQDAAGRENKIVKITFMLIMSLNTWSSDSSQRPGPCFALTGVPAFRAALRSPPFFSSDLGVIPLVDAFCTLPPRLSR